VNHEHVGEEFTGALKEIDDIVAAVNRQLSRYSPPFVIDLSVQLCCHIIKFLGFPLRWYTQNPRKRMIASFNENLSREYQSRIVELRRLSENITRAVQHCFEMDVKGFISDFPDFRRVFDDMLLSLARDGQRRDEENWAMLNKIEEERVRRAEEQSKSYFITMAQMFLPNARDGIENPIAEMMHGEAQQFTARMLTAPEYSGDRIDGKDSPRRKKEAPVIRGVAALCSRADIEAASHILFLNFERQRINPQDPEGEFFVEGDVAQRLQMWTANASSAILGVIGPRTFSLGDPTRLLVSSYIRAARGAGIPCISYFCTLSHESPPEGRTRETVELVGFLYALLQQLILYLPSQLPLTSVRYEERLEALDGTLRTWTAALSLFGDFVRSVATPYLLVAIHGWELLESRTTEPLLENLLSVLRKLAEEEEKVETKLKVLFTTSGGSRTLGEGLRASEICDISRGSAGRRPGGSGKGRQRLGSLEFSEV
jgi:hypothetical protein